MKPPIWSRRPSLGRPIFDFLSASTFSLSDPYIQTSNILHMLFEYGMCCSAVDRCDRKANIRTCQSSLETDRGACIRELMHEDGQETQSRPFNTMVAVEDWPDVLGM